MADALKNEIKPWLKEQWRIPPEQSAEFVRHMQDVLDVYKRPRNEKFPVISLDEKPVQLLAETRAAGPGRVRRQDHEYKRNGTASTFCAFEPLGNWRHLEVADHRKRKDRARFVKMLRVIARPSGSCW